MSQAPEPSVSVVVPAKNEALNLEHVFSTIPDWVDQVVLVDGHSEDDTVAVARKLRPDVTIVHQQGRGKGDGLRAGFAAATGEIIVTLDADGSTDGSEIPRFIAALTAGADFAKGSRFADGGGSADVTFSRLLGTRVLCGLVNVLYGTKFTDMFCGYNAFWAKSLARLDLSDCDGFEIETAINIRAAQAGLAIQEVANYEHPRIHGTSNLRIGRDGTRIAKFILRERFASRANKNSHGATNANAPAPGTAAVPQPEN